MYYIIYKTTSIDSGKEYIGQHKTEDLNDGYLGSGKLLKAAIRKYGRDNFKKTILFVFDNPEQMNSKEAEIVNTEYVLREDTYNLCQGGGSTESAYSIWIAKYGQKKGEERFNSFCNDITERQTGETNTFYGKEHSKDKKEYWTEIRGMQILYISPDNISTTFKSIREASRLLGIHKSIVSRNIDKGLIKLSKDNIRCSRTPNIEQILHGAQFIKLRDPIVDNKAGIS